MIKLYNIFHQQPKRQIKLGLKIVSLFLLNDAYKWMRISVKFIFFNIFFTISTLSAEIPSMINYQGILTNNDGIVVVSGNYDLSFNIYDSAEGNNAIWSEVHNDIEIIQGLYNIMLGSISSLEDIFFDRQYYLEISVDGNVMQDRITLSSSAYSLNTRSVNGNQGIPSGGIIMWSGTIESIPEGWALCDGQNGTPDLRDRFIVGASVDVDGVAMTIVKGSAQQTGGLHDVVLTEEQMPVHNHSIPGSNNSGTYTTTMTHGHYHVNNLGPTHIAGGDLPHENTPPFYALALIIKL